MCDHYDSISLFYLLFPIDVYLAVFELREMIITLMEYS